MNIQCPFCGSPDISLIGTDHFLCRACNQPWCQNIKNQDQQQPQVFGTLPANNMPFITTRKTTVGRILGNIIEKTGQVDEETLMGMDTTITRDFQPSSGGFMIHESNDITGLCQFCGGVVHRDENTRCEYHSSNELLCSRHSYAIFGKRMCRHGFYTSILLLILLLPFKILLQILGLIFLKD